MKTRRFGLDLYGDVFVIEIRSYLSKPTRYFADGQELFEKDGKSPEERIIDAFHRGKKVRI